jgi:hypothetical protein
LLKNVSADANRQAFSRFMERLGAENLPFRWTSAKAPLASSLS